MSRTWYVRSLISVPDAERTPYGQQQAAPVGPPDTTVNTELPRRCHCPLQTDRAINLSYCTGQGAVWRTNRGEWTPSSDRGGIIAGTWGVRFRPSWSFKGNPGWKLCCGTHFGRLDLWQCHCAKKKKPPAKMTAGKHESVGHCFSNFVRTRASIFFF